MRGSRRVEAGWAEVERRRVEPGWQRRGFGRTILAALERRARDLGYQLLSLDTTTRQIAAKRVYQTAGFRTVGRARLAGFDSILYEQRLM